MELDPSIRKANVKTIAFLIAVLVGIVSLTEYIAGSAAVSAAQAAPISSIHRPMLSTSSQVAASVADATAEAREERWDADESPQGTRSDAAH